MAERQPAGKASELRPVNPTTVDIEVEVDDKRVIVTWQRDVTRQFWSVMVSEVLIRESPETLGEAIKCSLVPLSAELNRQGDR